MRPAVVRFGLLSRRASRLLTLTLVVALLGGCGFLLYPERKDQPNKNIDPVTTVLDVGGFLIHPLLGVVAFAVDITNGTLFLAPGEKSAFERMMDSSKDQSALNWQPLQFNQAPTRDNIQRFVSEHYGQAVVISLLQTRSPLQLAARD